MPVSLLCSGVALSAPLNQFRSIYTQYGIRHELNRHELISGHVHLQLATGGAR